MDLPVCAMQDEFAPLHKYYKLCSMTLVVWLILDLTPALRAFPAALAAVNFVGLLLVLPAFLDFRARKSLLERNYALGCHCTMVAVMLGELMNLIPGNPYAAGLPYFLAMQSLLLFKLDKSEQSEKVARRLLRLFERRADVPPLRRAQALVLLGTALSRRGEFAASEQATAEAISVLEAQPDVPVSKIAASLADLCATLSREGKYRQSLEIGNRALELMEKSTTASKEEMSLLGSTLNNLGVANSYAGNSARALELYQRSLKLKLSIFGERSREAVVGLNNAGYAFLREAQLEKAAEYLEKAKRLATELGIKDDRIWPEVVGNLGDLHRTQGRFAEAEKELLEAFSIYERKQANKDLENAYQNLGKLYRDTNDFAKSETNFKNALALREKQYGSEHFKVAQTLEEYGQLLRKNDRFSEAEQLEARAVAIREELLK